MFIVKDIFYIEFYDFLNLFVSSYFFWYVELGYSYCNFSFLIYFFCYIIFFQDVRNIIGNIFVEWYNEYLYIGYNLDGKRILKLVIIDEVGN